MKLSKVIVVSVFLGIFAMATHVSVDSDTWWHLQAGKWMVEHGRMIQEDVFSFTSAGKPWQYPGLWVQILMFKIYDVFGPGGLNLWVSLMVLLIFYFVWRTTEGNELPRALFILLATIASAIYWAARPYLVSYLLFALSFYFLERNYRSQKGNLWWLVIFMVIWVNSHGGFLAGFILWAPYFVDAFARWLAAKRNGLNQDILIYKQKWIKLFWVVILMLLGTGLNPQGLNLWSLPFTTVSRQAEQLFIAEWQSPNFHDPTLVPFAWILVLSIVILGGARKRLSLYEILLLAGFGFLGLISVRNIFFFVIIAPAILLRAGEEAYSELKSDLGINFKVDFSQPPNGMGKVLNYVLVFVVSTVVFLRIASYLPASVNQEVFSNEYPVAAVEFLRTQELQGNMFNSYNYGGYLIWALPEYPVFVDGRADLHQDEIILTWYRVIRGSSEWRSIFEKWGIGFVLVEPGVPLLKELEAAGWIEIYQDEISVIVIPPEGKIKKD